MEHCNESAGQEEDSALLSDEGTNSSCSESEDDLTSDTVQEKDELDISVEEVRENYVMAGCLVPEEPPVHSLDEFRALYPAAFTEESESALDAVLGEIQLPYSISPFQETAVNALLNGLDVVCIVPTGSGKMLIIYLYAMALRKLPLGYRGLPDLGKSLVLAGMPLTSIMKQQMGNPYCPVAMLTMEGQMLDSSGEVVSEEKLRSGDFQVLFTHPEALSTDPGRAVLRILRKENMIVGCSRTSFTRDRRITGVSSDQGCWNSCSTPK
jgi:hypothetical protein